MRDKLNGAMPAVASPCDENDVFLEDTFASLMEHLAASSVNGFYLCGATGEGYKMKLDERRRAAEIAIPIAAKKNQKVIVHVGTNNTRDATALAEHAAASGADAVSSLPLTNVSQAQLVNYYEDIVKASGLPVLVYHVPVLTHYTPTLDEILELLDIEGVAGLKMTDWNMFMLRRVRILRPAAVILNGFDEVLALGLFYGADGGIGTNYNLFPELFAQICDASKAGDFARAIDLQHGYTAYGEILWRVGVAGVFEHLMRVRGFGPYCWRRPRPAAIPDAIKAVEQELNESIKAIEDMTK